MKKLVYIRALNNHHASYMLVKHTMRHVNWSTSEKYIVMLWMKSFVDLWIQQ